MNKEYLFTLSGDPVCIFKDTGNSMRVRDTYSENRCRCEITLANQHENQKMITEPIDIIFTFFIKNSCRNRVQPPSVIEMLRFINHIAAGVIYKSPALIYNVVLKKVFSNNPHTELIIKPNQDSLIRDICEKRKKQTEANQKKKK